MKSLAWMSEKKSEGKVLCKACSQRCLLKEGEYGKCGIRKNEDGELYLTVYGLAAAYNIDPIEKKPLFIFYQIVKYFLLELLVVILVVSFVKTMRYPNILKNITIKFLEPH